MKAMITSCLGILASLSQSSAAFAEIRALRCGFDDFEFFITIYSDGSPARLGTAVGIGDRARVFPDTRTGALVVVEVNRDGIPTTLTTIQPDLAAVHSRHVIGPFGEVVAPWQRSGKCSQLPL